MSDLPVRAFTGGSFRRQFPSRVTEALKAAVSKQPHARRIIGGPSTQAPAEPDLTFEAEGVRFTVKGDLLQTSAVESNFAGRVTGELSSGEIGLSLEGFGGGPYPMGQAQNWFSSGKAE